MFKELNDNLSSIEGEVSRLKTAVQHIDTAKAAAQAAVNAANTTNTQFKEHLQKVTKAVDSILKPHEDLIAATESLTKTISQIDFPNKLEQQAKELTLIKTILFIVLGVVVLGTLAVLVLKKIAHPKASTFARHTKPDTKLTLQKSLLANAQGQTLLIIWRHTWIDKKHERTTRVFAKAGRT